MSCRFNGRTQPRVLTNRHEADCADQHSDDPNGCRGCLPCTEPHCRVCRMTHADGTCAECKAATREDLHEIARMCRSLPAEVAHRGINGEAMTLLGPVSDVEARQHVEAAYLSGRLPEGWIEAAHGRDCPLLTNDPCVGCAGGELHPLTVLLTWQMVWRDALEHSEAPDSALGTAVAYLDTQLHYMGDFDLVPFDDFARDIRRCRTHLESVLHDGEQHDAGAPCMTCHVPLERVWGKDRQTDGWRCPRCKQTSTEAQYRYAVMNLYRDEATHLTDREMEERTGVKAGTVRVWANRGEVARRQESGRVVYSVADVEKRMTPTRVS